MEKRNLALVVVGCIIAAIAVGILVSGCVQPVVVEEVEGPEPYTLVHWSNQVAWIPPDDYNMAEGWEDALEITEPGEFGELVAAKWHEANPQYDHIEIVPVMASCPGGRVGQELMAMIRAGQGPHVFGVYGGRAYYAYDIGINLDDYLTDEEKANFIGYEDYFVDGEVKMVSGHNSFEYPVINATLVERACAQGGFDCVVPQPWSILSYDEYLGIAEAIKALDDGVYMSLLYAVNPSSQQMNWGLFHWAGIAAYDTDHFTGFAGGEWLMAELLRWYDDGYMHPESATGDDMTMLGNWCEGEVAIINGSLSLAANHCKSFVESGEAERWEAVPLLGVQLDPAVQSGMTQSRFNHAVFVAESVPEEYREAAISYILFAGDLGHVWGAEDTMPATYSQIKRGLIKPGVREEVLAYLVEHGGMDTGLSSPIYNNVREAWADTTYLLLNHELTPAEALAHFQASIAELAEE